ncbi:MAG TPA: class I SAM-dependent methyltransferase [Opitutaceae bacterium]|nr:class I SAM-dependent methyltransferase [Opitutaceae bacterium]
MDAAPNFDRLAGIYRLLEFSAFGRSLEKARFAFLGRLAECREILVLGEGDGRCLARLVRAAPSARIRCVDASAAMLARAAAHLSPEERDRVRFERADAFAADLPAEKYDAVLTLFFLDCFPAPRADELVARIRGALRPGAAWLWADFRVPERGLARWRARASLPLLYLFFRWQTGLAARELPPAEALLAQAGLACEAQAEFQDGFVRSAIWRLRPPIQPGSRT